MSTLGTLPGTNDVTAPVPDVTAQVPIAGVLSLPVQANEQNTTIVMPTTPPAVPQPPISMPLTVDANASASVTSMPPSLTGAPAESLFAGQTPLAGQPPVTIDSEQRPLQKLLKDVTRMQGDLTKVKDDIANVITTHESDKALGGTTMICSPSTVVNAESITSHLAVPGVS